MPKTNNPHPHFRFVYVDLPIEWQEAIDKAYKDFALEQVKKGKKPCKTDFVRFVFEFYLKRNLIKNSATNLNNALLNEEYSKKVNEYRNQLLPPQYL